MPCLLDHRSGKYFAHREEIANDAEAQATITGLNGRPLGGRSMVAYEAHPLEPRPPLSGNAGYGAGRRAGRGFGTGSEGVGDGGFRSPDGQPRGGGRRGS